MASLPQTKDLLDLTHTMAASLFSEYTYPWEVLPHIRALVLSLGAGLSSEEYDRIGEDVWIAKSAKVAPTACICGPTIIGPETEVRHCAYIRGSVLVGAKAVVGNSTELKNAILFDGVQAPHYNYVGDSVLGYLAHMGAGSIASNIKSDKTNITVRGDGVAMETGLRKIGTILGDRVEVGCNSVLCPGTVVGRDAQIYPLSRVRGIIPAAHIYKGDGILVPKHSL